MNWVQVMRDKDAQRRRDARMTMAELMADETAKRAARLVKARQAEEAELALIARRDPAVLAHHRYTMRFYHDAEPRQAWTDAEIRLLQNTFKQRVSPARGDRFEDPRTAAKWRAQGSYDLVVPKWRVSMERLLERYRDLRHGLHYNDTARGPDGWPALPDPAGFGIRLTDEQLARRDALIMKARKR